MASTHTATITMADGRLVLLSYGVPVAAWVPGRGYVRTSRRYSVTTTRHANEFTNREGAIVPPEEFAEIVRPLEVWK